MVKRDGGCPWWSGSNWPLELAIASAEPVVRVPLRVRFRAGLALVAFRDAPATAVYAALVALTIYGVGLAHGVHTWLLDGPHQHRLVHPPISVRSFVGSVVVCSWRSRPGAPARRPSGNGDPARAGAAAVPAGDRIRNRRRRARAA